MAGEVRRGGAQASDHGAGLRRVVHAQIQARHLRHVGTISRLDRPAVGGIHLRAGRCNAAGDAGRKRRG